MTGGETLIFAGICAATIVSAYTVKKILEYKKEVTLAAKNTEKDEKIIGKLTSTIDKALNVIESRDTVAPVRKLIGTLQEGDTIKLPDEKEMSAEAAKKRYPRKPKDRKLSGLFDDSYTVKNINLYESPPEFTIEHEGFEFPASAELGNDAIEQMVIHQTENR